MALPPEMQAQVDLEIALSEARASSSLKHTSQNNKVEAIRVAKEILTENRRIKPASEAKDIQDSDIIAFATSLVAYIES